ncbi:MAG: T9SS type A sorting domain-containing protein [Taibaiella sp.]|nr:T9SS type A sorting domain-containing protein [Taibaiella sp.]
MKRLSLLLLSCAVASFCQAQLLRRPINDNITANPRQAPAAILNDKNCAPTTRTAAKTTATAFYTETFGTGTAASLPTGWSTAALGSGAGSWEWWDGGRPGLSGGRINSTTAANGWMVFRKDSFATVGGVYLQSPVINCSTHSTVALNFESNYTKFQDSVYVWVGTNSSFATGTYTSYSVADHNRLYVNQGSRNTTKIHMDISGAAAGQSAVYIRFVFHSGGTDGYNWQVDDVKLSEIDLHDVVLSRSFLYEPEPLAYDGSIFNTPLAFVDSVYPVTMLSNYGSSSESVALGAQIYNGSTSVYTQTDTYPGLVRNAKDSIVQFAVPFKPTAIGNYACVMGATVAGDADMSNNVDSVKFSVTDTTWMQNQGSVSGGYYIHRPGTGALSYMQGVRFDVPTSSAGDTVTGFGVSFYPGYSDPTGAGKVKVVLYSHSGTETGWTYVATSVARPLASSDISTATNLIWADFRSDITAFGGDWSPFVLAPDKSYAALVQIENVTTQLVIQVTDYPNATGFSGFFGQSDSSNNSGSVFDFGATTATGSVDYVPLVRMYFGKATTTVDPNISVNDVARLNAIGEVYPNPANTSVTVPFTVAQDANATVTLSNVIGQVIKTTSVAATAGSAAKVNFSTSDLANGVYTVTVTANGQQSTARVTIAH